MNNKLYLFLMVLFLGCSNNFSNISNIDLDYDVRLKEKKYLNANEEINMGISLSGGGTRSASFNIGLMAGLDQEKLLKKFNYISSVSGGSYAAFWYFSKLYWGFDFKKNQFYDEVDDIFKVCYPFSFKKNKAPQFYIKKPNGSVICSDEKNLSAYRFQNHLKNNSTLGRKFSATNASFIGKNIDPAITFFAQGWRLIYSLPFCALDSLQLSRLFKYNYSPARLAYRNSLERIYGLYPDKTNQKGLINSGKYTNSRILNYRTNQFNLNDLNRLYTSTFNRYHIPIWIINTTADSNNFWLRSLNSKSNAPPYSKSIVEFNPFYFGNDYYGYFKSKDSNTNLSEIVEASGAALDSSNPYNKVITDIGGTIFSLGNYIKIGQNSIYLTDGGHSENLGAYSLIKRKLPVIVISDAEFDPKGKQTGINRLIEKLEIQNKIILSLENLNKNTHIPTHDNKKTPLPEIIRGVLIDKKSDKIISKIYYLKLRIIGTKYECKKDTDNCYPEYLKRFISYDKQLKKFNEDFPHSKTSDISYNATQYLVL